MASSTPQNNPQMDPTKDVSDWVTADEQPTGPQMSYLKTLAREAKYDLPGDMTKGRASELIEQLQRSVGRGGK